MEGRQGHNRRRRRRLRTMRAVVCASRSTTADGGSIDFGHPRRTRCTAAADRVPEGGYLIPATNLRSTYAATYMNFAHRSDRRAHTRDRVNAALVLPFAHCNFLSLFPSFAHLLQ